MLPVHVLAIRSIHRPANTSIPKVTTTWDHDRSTVYQFKNSHYEEFPIFKVFKKRDVIKNLLPKNAISYRTEPKKTVPGTHLSTLIEKLLQEINERKRHFTDFHVITGKNFNRNKACGLMILKFRQYPFVLKLFIERPETFINSHCKGLDNIWFFPMGGGVNRHITGLTRVNNAQAIRKQLDTSPRWSPIDIPRKWFWLPQKTPWLKITGYNIGNKKKIETRIPGTYGVIADAIDIDQNFSFFGSENSGTMTMEICNYLESRLDPHIDNFVIEKGTNKIVIVDTEHFPTVVGFKNKKAFSSYYDWYRHLIQKCAKDWLFRTKKDRLAVQSQPNNFALKQLNLD